MSRGYPCVGEVEALEEMRWLSMGNCQNCLYCTEYAWEQVWFADGCLWWSTKTSL